MNRGMAVARMDAGGLDAERLEVIAHDLVEHTPCGRLRRVRGRRTTRHMGVVANRSPAGAHRGLHRNLYDPLADER